MNNVSNAPSHPFQSLEQIRAKWDCHRDCPIPLRPTKDLILHLTTIELWEYCQPMVGRLSRFFHLRPVEIRRSQANITRLISQMAKDSIIIGYEFGEFTSPSGALLDPQEAQALALPLLLTARTELVYRGSQLIKSTQAHRLDHPHQARSIKEWESIVTSKQTECFLFGLSSHNKALDGKKLPQIS